MKAFIIKLGIFIGLKYKEIIDFHNNSFKPTLSYIVITFTEIILGIFIISRVSKPIWELFDSSMSREPFLLQYLAYGFSGIIGIFILIYITYLLYLCLIKIPKKIWDNWKKADRMYKEKYTSEYTMKYWKK